MACNLRSSCTAKTREIFGVDGSHECLRLVQQRNVNNLCGKRISFVVIAVGLFIQIVGLRSPYAMQTPSKKQRKRWVVQSRKLQR